MAESIAFPALDDTYGCLFIGMIFTTALWGASLVQLYFYFENHSSSDRWWIKIPVVLIWMLDTAHQCIYVHLLYMYLVKNFSNILYLNHFDIEGVSLIILTAFINLLVQFIFIIRIWFLSKRSYVLTGISSCFVLAHFAVTTYYFAISIHFTSLTQYTTVSGAERVLNSIGLLTDSTIAGILAYLLYSSRTGFAKTNSTIGFLAVYFVSTGFMMDLCSLAALVTSTLLPKTFVFLTILLIYPKLYTNSVLALLNTRQRTRERHLYDTESGISFPENLWVHRSGNIECSRSGTHSPLSTVIEIKVDAETLVQREAPKIL